MKDLTEEEAAAIRKRGADKSSYIRASLVSMKPGEIKFIERAEWNWKSKSPSEICGRIRRASKGRRKFICQAALDGSGWVIKCEK